MNTSLKTWLKKTIVFLVVAAMAIALFPFTGLKTVTKAAADDVPAHNKVLTVNEDGTYTIALNVTGDSEKDPQKVNVIVIVDTSGSMGEGSGTGAYCATNGTGPNLYGLIDGEYVPLERRTSGEWPRIQITFWYNGTQYTGQRYYYDAAATRLEATQQAVIGLAGTLLGYNGKDGNPNDTVEMALVSFSTNANTDIDKTTSSSTYIEAVNNLNDEGGTNWEAALQEANNVSFGDSDPTYVIFFSDGAPTFHATDGGYDNWNRRYSVYGSGQEEEPNMERSYTQARDDAKSLAEKVGVNNFYTIFAYGTDAGKDYMTQLTSYSGAPAGNNYSASDSAELNAAFAEILETIEMSGIGAVSMEDGTTSSVETTTGEISHLLTVDEDSYKYYRAGGKNDDDTEKYDSTENDGLGEEWTDAPDATFEDGAVKWDLKSEGVLENDVTYTVTFDCWPSQETLDIVADIKNDPSAYDKLDANIKKYIDKDGNLKTNTAASISYTDTRTGKSNSEDYDNPDPVATSAVESLAISKEWENELDGQSAAPITLTVTRDGKDKYTVELSENNKWTDSVYVSIGIIRGSGSSVEILEKGHDFTFTEPADLGYYWELEVPTVRPMLINNTVTMLILKGDAPYNNPDGTTEYTIDGKTYYVGDTGEASLTATNHRRARLNLTKVVDGEDADPDQTFPFTLNVVDSKADEGSEDNLNSDYYVWFSVWNGGAVDAVVSGAEKEMKDGEWTGYYYAPSESDIVVNLKAGDNLRFLNLPTGSTYSFTEGTLPDNYAFTKAELTAGEDSTFKGAQTSTGTIETTNTDYTVTYTNTYALTDIEITKVWADNNDQDGKRPTADEFKSYLVLKADGTEVTSANADKLTVTVDSEDSNKYLVKWTGLDRYADGEEITYTVEETEIEGYTTTGSPASDKGTITNTHTPEVIDVTVTKAWDDASNQDGKRPETLTLTLNGAPTGTTVPDPSVTKSEDGNSWTYTWTALPKYANGKEIAYTITEETVPTGYTCETTTVNAGGTITNSYAPEQTTVTVTKAWDDASNQDGKRPETLALTLNGAPEGTTVPEPTVTKSEDGNSWTYTWTGLPKYADGVEIVYTVTEGTVPEGYTCETTTVNAGGTITNKHTPEVTEATVKKVWNDAENQDGIRPETLTVTLSNGDSVTLSEANSWTATIRDLPKYANGQVINYTWTEDGLPDGYELTDTSVDGTITTLTNSHTPEETEATVVKVWDDAENQDGKRPETLTVTLSNGDSVTLSEDNDWTDTITGLPKYADGIEINYTWTEDGLPDGYELTGTAKEGTVTTLTNSYQPEVTSVSVKKVWDDANNQDGKRPTELVVTLSNGDSVTLNEANDWTATIEGLPVYSAGTKINYTWTEATVDGYTLQDPVVEGMLTTLTNTHEPEKTEASVKKVWDDADDQDGKRPASLNVTLSNGTEDVATFTLDELNQWTAKAENLPKYANGQEITYTWTEAALPDGYTLTDNATEGTVTTLTNTHIPEVTEVSVTKVWDDDDNARKTRPETIDVQLLADGRGIATQTLDESNGWAYTWTDSEECPMPKYNQGVEIKYTVDEPDVPDGYKKTMDGFTITNALTSVVVDPPVQKIIKGNDSLYNKGDFTFTIENVSAVGPGDTAIEDIPMPKNSNSITNSSMWELKDKPGFYEFGEIEFTQPGVYVYKVTESGKVDGVTNDPDAETGKTLTFTVTESKTGKLSVSPTTDQAQFTFTNTYTEQPDTGDHSNMILWLAIIALALAAGGSGLILLKKSRKHN